MYRRAAVVVGLVAGDAAVLVVARPDFPALTNALARPHEWFVRAGTDAALAALAGAALWLASAWLGLGLLAAAASLLPGASGRAAAMLSRLVLPAVVRRLVAGSAGLGVLVAPVAATADPPGMPPHHRPAVAATALSTPSWPLDPPAVTTPPAPSWPVDPPVPPAVQPTRTAHRAAPAPAAAAREVRVQPGDSLWLIAARHLGADATEADVARSWPRWYAANRQVIGSDPALIVPGQILRVPDEGER